MREVPAPRLREGGRVTARRRLLTLGVLAGAYRGRQEHRAILTHAAIEGAARALCGYDAENLVDSFGAERGAPSCPRCLKKYERLLRGERVRLPKGAA